MRKDVRCLIGLHKWVRRHNPQAGDYSAFFWECARCDKERDVPTIPPLPG